MPEQSPNPLPTCPMAETCKGMMEKPFSRITLVVPGLVFIALGILIVVEPRILVWVLALAFVLIGFMMLMMSSFIRRVGTRFQSKQQPMM